MPVIDGFFTSSLGVGSRVDASGTASQVPNAFPAVQAGVASNINAALLSESMLLSVAPDPALYGQTLVVTGIDLVRVQRMIIDGASASFVVISSTQINVTLPLLATGVKSIYAEYV